jgi:endoglucanase
VVRLPVYPRTCFNTGGSPYNSPAPYPVGTAGGTQTALTSDEYVEKLLKPAVDYATQKGMYVIIDYHQIDNTNGQSATDATTFWTYMAGKFASYTNVLYEAFNEPIDGSAAWSTLKPRVQAWVDAIRKDAPNNIIIVPSMSYDQKPGDAASSPPTGSNFVFTAHVYPGNWNSNFKQQVATAVTKAPVFFTEWGYVLNGSDANLGTSSSTWGSDFRTQVDGNGASWTAWVADNSWTPNMFSDTGIKTLTAFGSTTKDWLSAKAASDWVK